LFAKRLVHMFYALGVYRLRRGYYLVRAVTAHIHWLRCVTAEPLTTVRVTAYGGCLRQNLPAGGATFWSAPSGELLNTSLFCLLFCHILDDMSYVVVGGRNSIQAEQTPVKTPATACWRTGGTCVLPLAASMTLNTTYLITRQSRRRGDFKPSVTFHATKNRRRRHIW